MKTNRFKKIIIYLLVFLLFTPYSVLSAEEPGSIEEENLLRDGGFESGAGESEWGEWFDEYTESETVAPTAINTPNVTASVNEGNQAMQMTASGLWKWRTSIISQTVAIQPNEWFELKGAFNVTHLSNAIITFTILFYDAKDNQDPHDDVLISKEFVDRASITDGYEILNVTGITPNDANMDYANIQVHIKANENLGGGTVFVDSLHLNYEWAPKSLISVGKTDTSIDLTWTASTHPLVVKEVDEYVIYQDGVEVGTADTTQYTVEGLSPTTAYHFTVKAKDSSGKLSIESDELYMATKAKPGYYTIMPLGGSSTSGTDTGEGVPGAYRIKLWDMLVNEDDLNIDFVGSSTFPETLPDPLLMDIDHEGHAGFKVNEINEYMDHWVKWAVYEPDMILLYSGTNNMFNAGTASEAPKDLDELIGNITTRLPNTQVIVASLPMLPAYINDNNIQINNNLNVMNYNAEIPGIVEKYKGTGKFVSFVDLYAVISEDDLQGDHIHPTREGYDKMAIEWDKAIHDILSAIKLESSSQSKDSITLEWKAPLLNSSVTHDVYDNGSTDEMSVTDDVYDNEDSNDISSYDVYVKDNLNTYQEIFNTVVTNYTISDLSANTQYTVIVKAKDAKGNVTTISNPVIASTLDDEDSTAPTVPTNVISNAKSTETISIEWTPSIDESSVTYDVHVYNNANAQSESYQTAETNYNLTGLTPNTQYSITIKAIDAAGNESGINDPPLVVTTESEIVEDEDGTGGEDDGEQEPPRIFNPIFINDKDKKDISTSNGLTQLLFIPNNQNLIDQINGEEQTIVLDAKTEEIIDHLEVEISLEALKLAFEKQKTIVINSNDFSFEYIPDFIAINDDYTELIFTAIKSDNPIGVDNEEFLATYDFSLSWDDEEEISQFQIPAKITFELDKEPDDPEKVGVFYLNEDTGKWIYVGGEIGEENTMTASLNHFSQYAVIESSKTFADIQDHWAKHEIEVLTAKQIINGMSVDSYDPNGQVTRAQFAKMLSKAMHLIPQTDETLPFTDVVPTDWYYSDIQAAYQAGIINGMSANTFAPKELLSREQMAAILVNAYLFSNEMSIVDYATTDELSYSDNDMISSWANPYVLIASSLELVQGANNSFMPQQKTDRSQAAAVIYRFISLIKQENFY